MIDLPRPRDLRFSAPPALSEYTDKIWLLIEQEVREAIRLEADNIATAHS